MVKIMKLEYVHYPTQKRIATVMKPMLVPRHDDLITYYEKKYRVTSVCWSWDLRTVKVDLLEVPFG